MGAREGGGVSKNCLRCVLGVGHWPECQNSCREGLGGGGRVTNVFSFHVAP